MKKVVSSLLAITEKAQNLHTEVAVLPEKKKGVISLMFYQLLKQKDSESIRECPRPRIHKMQPLN